MFCDIVYKILCTHGGAFSMVTRTVRIQGRVIPYTIRRSAKATRVSLRIGQSAGLELVVPPDVEILNPDQVVRGKASWILRKLDFLSTSDGKNLRLSFSHGSTLHLLGREIVLELDESAEGKPSVNVDGRVCRITARHTDEKTIKQVLFSWYREEAKRIIPHRAAQLASVHSLTYTGVKVRDQRTRWGSCSSGGSLNFNWRLILAPPAVMDYLIVHELAHLREGNHSSKFWDVVAKMCPPYQEAERWIREHGLRLSMYS
jgi:predicted metal-dependent hydrolase